MCRKDYIIRLKILNLSFGKVFMRKAKFGNEINPHEQIAVTLYPEKFFENVEN